MALIENSLIPSYCYGSQALVDFFGDICVTDRNDQWLPHCFEGKVSKIEFYKLVFLKSVLNSNT